MGKARKQSQSHTDAKPLIATMRIAMLMATWRRITGSYTRKCVLNKPYCRRRKMICWLYMLIRRCTIVSTKKVKSSTPYQKELALSSPSFKEE
jgi:hypothetical protein